jgi:hypothetical protein
MRAGPAFFAAAAPSGPAPWLDGYATNLWSATSYSHKALTAYGGDARLSRRSDNNNTHTVSFSGTLADLAAEESFSGGVQMHLRTSYDHSGNSNHFGESSGSNTIQPRTVAVGVSEPFGFTFASAAGYLVSDNNNGGPAAITVHLRANYFNTSGSQMLMELSPDVNSAATAFYIFLTGGKLRVGVFFNTTTTGIIYEYADTLFGLNDSGQVCSFVLDTSQTNHVDKIKVYKNGALVTPQSTIFNAAGGSGNFISERYYLGSRGGSTLFSSLRVRHLAIHHAAVNATDIAAIHTAMLAA